MQVATMLDEKPPIKQKTKPVRKLAPELEFDKQLAVEIQEGNREALVHLVDRHLGPLHRYLSRRLGPGHEEAIDRAIEAGFSEALRHLEPYAQGTADAPMRLWLIRLANRQLVKQKQDPGTAHDAPASEESELARLRETLDTMPPRQQAAFTLALIEQLPPGEIAAALGTSQDRAMGLVRSALRHASQGIDVKSLFEGLG